MDDESRALLHELLGAIRGINGDSGLIGRVESVARDVTDIKVTIPSLATKAECATLRAGCAATSNARKDHRWMRRKDAALIAFGACSAMAALAAIGKSAGWW